MGGADLRATFVPDTGVTMKTNDGHLQVVRRNNVVGIRLLDSTVVEEQAIMEISRDLKLSIHAVEKPVVILDFVRVEHMSSRMLGALLEMQHRVEKHGGRMGLVHLQPSLMEIFTITDLKRRLSIFETVEQALHATL